MFRSIFVVSLIISFSSNLFAFDCSQVKAEKDNSPVWKQVHKYISVTTQSNTVKLRQIIKKDDWYVVEYDSNDYEPVINVLKKTAKGYSKKAGWGGMPEEGDSITDYLAGQAKGVPRVLMQCFSPRGEPFANTYKQKNSRKKHEQ